MESWEPNSVAQAEVLRRSETELLTGGSRGGGKTELGLAWLAEPECIEHPRYRSLVIRKDYDDLSDWIFRARSFYKGFGEVVGNPAIIRWKGGGQTNLGHWKDKNTLHKYIGHEYWKILIEELTQTIPTLADYKLLQGSLRMSKKLMQDTGMRPQLLGTTNPGGPGHRWVKDYFVDSANSEVYKDPQTGYTRLFIPMRASDNPALSEGYVRWLDGLPEPYRSMWRDGDWECYEGQFFTWIGKPSEPWEIGAKGARGRLFGSLDIGLGHDTSFGLWYLGVDGFITRLFTYKANGHTHEWHAREIHDKVASFHWTGGEFPVEVWVGHDAWTRARVNESQVRAPIDEYEDVFRDKGTLFSKANTDRENGCGIMKACYDERGGEPRVRYWDRYNMTYVEDMQAMLIDPNHRETYKKVDGDDTPDEVRYGLTGLYTWESNERMRANRKPSGVIPLGANMMFSGSGYESVLHETNLS